MTRSRMAIQAEESRADQKAEGFKQQLADEPELEPVDDLVELEEIIEEAKGDEEEETPIRDYQERIKKKEEKEEEIKEEEEKEKKLKNEKQKKKVVEIEKKKGKSEADIEKKKEATLIECKEVPYPLVPPEKIKSNIWPKFLISSRNWKLLGLLEKQFIKCPSMPKFLRIC